MDRKLFYAIQISTNVNMGKNLMKLLSSIQTRMLGIIFMFALLILSIFIVSTVIINKQKSDGLLINLAGRQRMLSQKMTKELLLFSTERKDEQKKGLRLTMNLFEKTLFALKDGGKAPTDLKMSKFRECPPAQDAKVKKQLEEVVSLWKPFQTHIHKFIKSSSTDNESLNFVVKNNINLLKEMNTAVGMMQNLSEKKSTYMFYFQSGALCLGVILSSFAYFFFKKFIITPILKIKDGMEEGASGNLSVRMDKTLLEHNDELSLLSQWFNTFFEKISKIIKEINLSAQMVNTSGKEIAAASERISEGAHQQSASFEELSSSVQANAMNADRGNKIAQLTKSRVEDTGSKVSSMIDAMANIEKSSNQIAKAVELITDIADQTNMLALNAAIEAARAGEQGQGFAVVADEVRKLAKRSADSAREIETQIINSMLQVNSGVDLSQASGESLNEIIASIKDMATQIDQISTATQEQAAAMEQNTSITETNASASDMLSSSARQLAGQSDTLQDLISRFKL